MKKSYYTFFKSLASALILSLPQLAAAQTPSPNFDFENWTTSIHNEPMGWFQNNTYIPITVTRVSEIAGVTGSAVHIATDSTTLPIPGYVFNTTGNIFMGEGGVPYSGSGIPATLNGYYRYNVVAGDSARIFIALKKSGVMLSLDSFSITGSQPAFTAFSFPLTTISVVPDSIIFMASSGTFIPLGTTPAGSYLDLDELHFENGANSFPLLNGSFDNWHADTTETPDNWSVSGDVSKTTDSHSGSYAIKLVSADNGTGLQSGSAYGTTIDLSAHPLVDTLTGFYKYSTTGADHGFINVILWDHVTTGNSQTKEFLLPPAATYTPFSIPLNNTINASDFNFVISSSHYSSVTSGSTLLVDGLKLKPGMPLSTVSVQPKQIKLAFYPVPCKNEVHISFDGLGSVNNAHFVLYNLSGQEVSSGNVTGNTIYLQHMPCGVYVCAISSDDKILYGRIEIGN